MNVRAQRIWGDAAKSASALLLLIVILVGMDERVQEQLGLVASADRTFAVTSLASKVGEVATVVVDAARTQSIEHAPLMIFVLTATILVLWMVRS